MSEPLCGLCRNWHLPPLQKDFEPVKDRQGVCRLVMLNCRYSHQCANYTKRPVCTEKNVEERLAELEEKVYLLSEKVRSYFR